MVVAVVAVTIVVGTCDHGANGDGVFWKEMEVKEGNEDRKEGRKKGSKGRKNESEGRKERRK
jgi:hypothetical protein